MYFIMKIVVHGERRSLTFRTPFGEIEYCTLQHRRVDYTTILVVYSRVELLFTEWKSVVLTDRRIDQVPLRWGAETINLKFHFPIVFTDVDQLGLEPKTPRLCNSYSLNNSSCNIIEICYLLPTVKFLIFI